MRVKIKHIHTKINLPISLTPRDLRVNPRLMRRIKIGNTKIQALR